VTDPGIGNLEHIVVYDAAEPEPIVTLKPDIERLDRLVAWATEEEAKRLRGEPSEWDQGVYLERTSSCGTVCCIAGKVTLEDGVPIKWSPLAGENPRDEMGWTFPGNPSDYAREALGLSKDQAGALFHGANTPEMLREIVEGIKQGLDDDLIWSLHDELRAAAS
jgi:hypothetical protein